MTAFDSTVAFETALNDASPTEDVPTDLDSLRGGESDEGAPFIDAAETVEDYHVAGRSLSLFEGDEGALTFSQRRTLVYILKHRYISAEQNPAEWAVLMESLVTMRSRLNDLFLDLHLDREAQIAFKRQATPEGDNRFPTLLRDVAHTREETIIIVFLRERYRSERSGGAEVVYVDRDEIMQAVERFRPPDANDQSGDRVRVENAIRQLLRSDLLFSTADEERMRIAPVIEVLLPLRRLHELLSSLLTLNNANSVSEPDRPGAAPAELDFDYPTGEQDPTGAPTPGDPR